MKSPRDSFREYAAKLYMETKVLVYILSPRSRANPMNVGEWAASMVLFLTWGIITFGIAFGHADAPPYYPIISGIVLIVFGRMWGINLAHQAVGLSPHPEEYRPWEDEDEKDGKDGGK